MSLHFAVLPTSTVMQDMSLLNKLCKDNCRIRKNWKSHMLNVSNSGNQRYQGTQRHYQLWNRQRLSDGHRVLTKLVHGEIKDIRMIQNHSINDTKDSLYNQCKCVMYDNSVGMKCIDLSQHNTRNNLILLIENWKPL